MKKLLRLAQNSDLCLTEQELKNRKEGTIGVWFGYDRLARDFQSVAKIAEEIRKEYPQFCAGDMEVWYMEKELSEKYAGRTFLRVSISIDDFIMLRKKGKLLVL